MNSEVAADATTAATAIAIRDDDIIEINVGGKIISVLRSTLTLVPDTMFANMFSGRWEGSLKLDSIGRVFLDEDSELIEIVINFLRMKKREDPSRPVQSPMVRKEKKENFASLLDYYGLTEFFDLSPVYLPFDIDINNIDVVKPNGGVGDDIVNDVIVTKIQNKIYIVKTAGGSKDTYFVACTPQLDPSEGGSFWKVTVNNLKSRSLLFLGIIGSLCSSNDSYSNISSYGWTNRSQVQVKGIARQYIDSGWSGFTQGECLYFHFKSNKLTMYSVKKKKTFTMNIGPTEDHTNYYIHFNMTSKGDQLMLETLNEEDRALLLL